MTNTLPKPFTFILMPFSEDFTDAYKLAIKPACEAAGTHAERVDEQVFHDDILQRIYNQIAKADVIVADMTGRNPNVFYETGYAHALGKSVILLTRKVDDIPFDLQHYPHIVYGESLSALREQLERHVRHSLETAAATSPQPLATIEVEVNGVRLGLVPSNVPTDVFNGWLFTFETSVINSVARAAKTIEYQIGVVTPDVVKSVEVIREGSLNPIREQGGGLAHHWPRTFRVLPGAWQTVSLKLVTAVTYRVGDVIEGLAIRVFTDSGYLDFPFFVSVGANP